MKEYICDCVNPVWGINKLCKIIDDAKEISRDIFLLNCRVNVDIIEQIYDFPNDFEFFLNGEEKIMFYVWSAAEFFYK